MANILVSFEWLKEHVKTDASIDDFVKKMTDAGNSVERIHFLQEMYDQMVVGRILAINPHPNADKLRVVTVDVGKKVEIVCGGTNLAVEHLVCVALPGAKVRWHGEGELVELKETGIRGVNSFGMICAPAEIGLEKLQGDSHEIWDITELTEAKSGISLAKALEFEDTLFDIEVTTNRPDAMSIVGQARETFACGLGKTIEKEIKKRSEIKKADFKVAVKDKDLCPRYQAVVIEGVKVKSSPWWMQKRLLFSGHRPINNVVDITNYVLHELGQPLHAFDADKIQGNEIIVRTAKKGELIQALDGNSYELNSSMLVIADKQNPIAIAGVMGGELSGTTDTTTRIVIESANFNPTSVRRTARALNLYSDSSSLFEKGLSTESTEGAMERAIELICELTGGKVVSQIYDERAETYKPLVFLYRPEKINQTIGMEIPEKEQKSILEKLGFAISDSKAVVPFWRDHDIENEIDLSEEIVRVYGYDNIPSMLPEGVIPLVLPDKKIILERNLKQILKGAGVSESYSSAFTNASTLEKFGIEVGDVVKIENPLSDELAYIRSSLIPSMLNIIEQNQHRFEAAALFEIAHVHHPRKDDIPKEDWRLLIAEYGPDGGEQVFLFAKGILERVLREVGVSEVRFESTEKEAHFHPGRTAEVFVKDQSIGYIGEVAPIYQKAFGVDRRVVLADINLDLVLPQIGSQKYYSPLPEFQETKRDLSFVVEERVIFEDLHKKIQDVDELIEDATFVDVYQGKGIENGKKSITFRLSLRAQDHTLSSEEADVVMKKVEKMLNDRFEAIIR